MFSIADISIILPELALALGAMALLMLGVFVKGNAFRAAQIGAVVILIAAAGLAFTAMPVGHVIAFNGLFVTDAYGVFLKLLISFGGIAALLMAGPFMERSKLDKFEFPVLVLLATLGMYVMVSAYDMLTLYVGLELQSLSLYVLAAFNRDRQRSTEAGLKYFVLGALSSGMLLYGISLIYGFTGATGFDALAARLTAETTVSAGVTAGIVFLLAGLAFKVSAVPFHMWAPDVYEGAETPVTAFFASAPKIAAFGLLLRAIMMPFPHIPQVWEQVIVFLSVASMGLGAVAAIAQTNIKRLMAYSSIGHVGYALIGLAAGTQDGVSAVLTYIAIYLTMTVGAFACILQMRRGDEMVEEISDLSGLSRTNPVMAFSLAIFMFSLAGIPLLLGFIGKLNIFFAAIHAELYYLAGFGVLTSVIGAYYYLRVVKVMYFDEPAPAFSSDSEAGTSAVMGVTALVNSPVGYLAAGALVAATDVAARALLG